MPALTYPEGTPCRVMNALSRVDKRAERIQRRFPEATRKEAYAIAMAEWAGMLFTMEGGDDAETQWAWVNEVWAFINTHRTAEPDAIAQLGQWPTLDSDRQAQLMQGLRNHPNASIPLQG